LERQQHDLFEAFLFGIASISASASSSYRATPVSDRIVAGLDCWLIMAISESCRFRTAKARAGA
jgi:hypothetical protein